MKSIALTLLYAVAVLVTPSCANQPSSPDLIAAITPATSVLVIKKPALVAPLKTVLATIQKVSDSGVITPADLLANFTSIQQKNPELLAIVQLVGAAYRIAYTPDASNVATLQALAAAVQAGLQADSPPASP